MNWLMILLGIFRSSSRKIVKEQYKIDFTDLDSWLDKHSHELIEKENLHEYLTSYLNFLKDKRWLLRQEMEGDNLPEDLRPDCEELLQLLISRDELDLREALVLNKTLKEKLEKILPGYEIEIVNPLLKLLSKVDDARKKFTDRINQSGYPRIANLHKRLSSLHTYQSRVDNCEDELRNKKRRLIITEDKKQEKEKQLSLLHEDPNSNKALEMRNKKENLTNDILDIENRVSGFFSEIKPLLQRYGEINANDLLNSYLENPLDAFLHDEGLAFKHSLQHLRAVLNSGKFSWSVEENISSLEKLDLLDAEKLESLQIKLISLKRELDVLEEPQIDEDKKIEIDDTEYRLQHFNEQIEKLEEEIYSLEEKIEVIKEEWDREVQLFQNLVNIGFGISLEIKV